MTDPGNLREMLAEAKDGSELMIDLAYAALYFGDPDMAEEVGGLENLSELIQDMRGICIFVRNPREAEGIVGSQVSRRSNGGQRRRHVDRHPQGRARPNWSPTCPKPRRSRTGCSCRSSHLAHRHCPLTNCPCRPACG